MSKDYKTVDYHPGRLKRLFRKLLWLVVVYLPHRRPATVLTRNGLHTFDSKDKTTGRILHVYRNHEFDEMMLVVQYLRDKKLLASGSDGTVIDVGGYLGMSSTAFLLEDVFGKAIAFEPSPDNYRLLNLNIGNNHLEDRLQAFNMALSDKNTELLFELSDENFGDHRIRHGKKTTNGHYNEGKRNVIRVAAHRFDDFLDQNPDINSADIRLLWMDIQGHEGRFLKGTHKFYDGKSCCSGIGKEEFVTLVSGMYRKYVTFESGYAEEYFDLNRDPKGGSSVMLCN